MEINEGNGDIIGYNKLKYEILLNTIMAYANDILALKYHDILALQNDASVEEYRFLAIVWLKGVCHK
jgi:hypothetical protein